MRSWPQSHGPETVIVRWPRNFSMVVILGVFTLVFVVLIPGMLYWYASGNFPSEIGLFSFLLVFLILSLFGFVIIGGFISGIKNYRNPFMRFLADRDGIYLNITFKMKDAFFISWDDIKKIEKTQIKRSMGGSGGTMIIDSVGIFLNPSSSVELPKVMRGVEQCTTQLINFPGDTLNVEDLDGLIKKINKIK